MRKRVLRIWPSWLFVHIARANKMLPGGSIHDIGNNKQNDRDVCNLMDQFPPHLKFTEEEERRGEEGLRNMGIPAGAPFVCLAVRIVPICQFIKEMSTAITITGIRTFKIMF